MYIAHTIFLSIPWTAGKNSQKIWVIFKKLPRIDNYPMGENSLNLVTLLKSFSPFVPKSKECLLFGDALSTRVGLQTSITPAPLLWTSGWPDWANFRPNGRLFTLGGRAMVWSSYFFHGASYVLILTKNGWATFSPTHLVTQFWISKSKQRPPLHL
jgi:hypothetical protein